MGASARHPYNRADRKLKTKPRMHEEMSKPREPAALTGGSCGLACVFVHALLSVECLVRAVVSTRGSAFKIWLREGGLNRRATSKKMLLFQRCIGIPCEIHSAARSSFGLVSPFGPRRRFSSQPEGCAKLSIRTTVPTMKSRPSSACTRRRSSLEEPPP